MTSENQILVREITGKDTVFKTTCYESFVAQADTELLVSVTEVEGTRTVVNGEDTIKYIDGVIEILKGCAVIGCIFFPEAAAVLMALAGIGTGLKSFLHFFDHSIAEKLKELEKSIHELEKQMYNSFADLKLFITETEFTAEIITDIGVLMKLQRNCLVYQNKESVENFRIAYQQKSPLTLAYTLMSLLEQQPTNPLAMAMAADRNEKTFKKWETIFKSVFGQLLFIEGFASGLLKDKNSYDSERILEKCEQLNSMMIRWREDYGFDKNWTEIDTHVKDFVKTSSALSNSEKADFIEKLLDMYSKKSFDSYWICVFNKCQRITDYAYHCPNEADQLIVYSDKNSKILVYRSREAYTLNIMDFDRVQKVFDFDLRTGLFYSGSLDDAIQKELIDKQVVRGDSFICIVDSNFKPEIRFTRDFKQKRAPGAFEKIAMVDQSDKEMDKITQRMLVIALP